MKRIRTIHQCVVEIKKIDNSSAITEYFIRSLIKSGEIPSIKSGTKVLVDLDCLISYIDSHLQYNKRKESKNEC